MKELQTIIDSLGLSEYINSILVSKGGMPSFMIQSPDYKESKAEDKITKRKLQKENYKLLKNISRSIPINNRNFIFKTHKI
jgi:hypothetical protein